MLQVSKPEREEYWNLFKDCGISREEFNSLSDQDFSNYLNFLSSSLSMANEKSIIEDDIIPDEDPEENMSLEDSAKKLAKKCEKMEIEGLIKEGENIVNDFLIESSNEYVTYNNILNHDEFPPEKNPAFSGADADSQGKF